MSRRPASSNATPTNARKRTAPRTALFYAVIPLIWVVIVLAVEWGLVLVRYGDDADLFERVEPGLMVDNPAYLRRFYSLRDGQELSQRSNLFPAQKAPGSTRVIVVGGSTAQGFPFQRNHSFTGIAQAALRSQDVDIEVINLGNSAMTSYYARAVLREVVDHDPDLIVVYAGHNEYYGTPSSFTGGTHASRLALIRLKKYRTVQLLEGLIRAVSGGVGERESGTLMERRFEQNLFPPDAERDEQVAELLIRNLDAGLRPLRKAGIPALIFEPVSNLISMPPFRSDTAAATGGALGGDRSSAVRMYQERSTELEAGRWVRREWEQVRDLDEAPFRARSVLVRRLEAYATEEPLVTWIPTADELERRAGPEAFSDRYFIDHVHFNFEGQRLLGSMLAESIVRQLFFSDEQILAGVRDYLSDPDRVRNDVQLTDYWELDAYSRIRNLETREPFASMPVPKAAAVIPERVLRNSLFQTPDFLRSLQGAPSEEQFYLALDHYKRIGDRDEWIRNMNAYVHIFPGHYQTHLAYGIALLEDDAEAYLAPAGSYLRRAYVLSGRSAEVSEIAEAELRRQGMGHLWVDFRARYFE